MYNAIPITHDFNPVHVLQSYFIVEKASDYQKINWPLSICNSQVREYRAVLLMLEENGNLNSKVTEVNSLLRNIQGSI